MTQNIFLVTAENELREMQPRRYESEDVLQALIADFPRLLASSSDDSELAEWLIVSREISVPDNENGGGRWALDHLFLDGDGVPVLVEVKRSTDTRIRREVVGQMLDYAANAVAYWPIEHIQSAFAAECDRNGMNPQERLESFLGGRVDEETFWTKVKTNLQAGRIRMLFVADQVPRELRRIIEFLNEQMDPAEVLGIEIRQFSDGQLRTLAPVVFGRTAGAETRKATVSAATQQSTSAVQAVVDAFNELAKGKYETSGAAKRYRQIKLPELPERVHYELIHTPRYGVTPELHAETKDYKFMAPVLETLAKDNPQIRGATVEFDPVWMGAGRLRAFQNNQSPEIVAQTMLELIERTRIPLRLATESVKK